MLLDQAKVLFSPCFVSSNAQLNVSGKFIRTDTKMNGLFNRYSLQLVFHAGFDSEDSQITPNLSLYPYKDTSYILPDGLIQCRVEIMSNWMAVMSQARTTALWKNACFPYIILGFNSWFCLFKKRIKQ